MGIFKAFAKQNMMAPHQALLCVMNSCSTYEATTGTEEQVGIVI
jgi:hypothetical protein